MLYLFSDGFIGQFNSETGKKYFTKNFRELLKTVSVFDADKQQLLIQHELKSFAKNSPQIDDILVIGFRVP
jgi:serine phosphatase RsbU (regulator of sigma subunit)